MIKSNLGNLMARHKHKLVDVADATGLHRSTVTKIYNDDISRIDLDALCRLCILYECELGDLLTFEDDGSITLPDAKEAKAKRIKAAQLQKKKTDK